MYVQLTLNLVLWQIEWLQESIVSPWAPPETSAAQIKDQIPVNMLDTSYYHWRKQAEHLSFDLLLGHSFIEV